MKKWIFVILSVAILLFLILGIFWCWNGRPSECTFARIQPGMKLDEVQIILGPGEEIPRVDVPVYPPDGARIIEGKSTTKVVDGERFFKWAILDGTFYISFKNDRVYEKLHLYVPLF
jgi:hypothetical protein